MKIINRTLYLGYYLKQLNRKTYSKFLGYASKISGKSKIALMSVSILDVYRYNISILEYFQFGFYNKSKEEKKKWAGTGTMYEFQKRVNPVSERAVLEDKRLFYKNYTEFFKHKMFTLQELKDNPDLITSLFKTQEKLVLKKARGKVGQGVEIFNTQSSQPANLISYLENNKFDLVETYIKQHSKLNELSPSAVNTIRIFTQLRSSGEYEVLGCRIRISVNSPVDNMGAGNLAAPVDEATGVVSGPGVYSDITKKPESIHPVTKINIIGFQIPYWKEALEMVKTASLKHPQNKSIGWDVVITEDGPGLIEGNHDWCKLVWQLPVNEGLKYRLDV